MDIDYFKNSFHFTQESSEPLYAQLAAYIGIQIKAGVLKPGDQMIAEMTLSDILHVSRTTIRQAMNRLVEDGLLVRSRGKGSFIADQKLKRNISTLYHFTENIREAGAIPSSIVLSSQITEVDRTLADKLQMPNGQTRAFLLIRLRCANDEPLLYETTFIPSYLCPGIERFDFSHLSLYETLSRSYSLSLYHAAETIEAIVIDRDAGKRLKCKANTPGYKIERTSFLNSGYVFEYTTSITRADKCLFQLDLYNGGGKKGGTVGFERRIRV